MWDTFLGGLLTCGSCIPAYSLQLKAQRWTSGLLSTFQKVNYLTVEILVFQNKRRAIWDTKPVLTTPSGIWSHCQFNQCYGLIFEQAWSLDDIQTKQSLHLADAPGCQDNSGMTWLWQPLVGVVIVFRWSCEPEGENRPSKQKLCGGLLCNRQHHVWAGVGVLFHTFSIKHIRDTLL